MAELATISENQELVSKELNTQILAVLNNNSQGFQKAFVMATAIQVLKERLTKEFMQPIMALQGSNLGFKSDKDKTGGYPEEEVKGCLIDAVLLGLQPTGNEFNIIGGNMYPTRQGFGSLLEKINGLKYNLTYKNPTTASDQKSANCIVTIDWDLNGEKGSQIIDFPIKSNAYATADALLGKAERKARRWLFNKLKGTDIPDGDIHDISHTEVSSKPNPTLISQNKEAERVKLHIANPKTVTVAILEKCKSAIRDQDVELLDLYYTKLFELAATPAELDLLPVEWLMATDNMDNWDNRKRELAKK